MSRKDPFLDHSSEYVGHILESVAEDCARSVLLNVCQWLAEEATVTEIAAELLRGTSSTDLTAAKDTARKVTDEVVSALRRRVGWEL